MTDRSIDELVQRLRSRGVRITAPRRMVLRALLDAGSHATAEQLHRRVTVDHPDVSASSVYRTMELLTELGVVTHVHLGHGPAQYHLAGDVHAHLVCDDCGATVELEPALSRPFAERVERELGFVLDLGHFALTGRCAHCAPGLSDQGPSDQGPSDRPTDRPPTERTAAHADLRPG